MKNSSFKRLNFKYWVRLLMDKFFCLILIRMEIKFSILYSRGV